MLPIDYIATLYEIQNFPTEETEAEIEGTTNAIHTTWFNAKTRPTESQNLYLKTIPNTVR